MKKILASFGSGLASLVLVFALATPASACIGPDGKPVEGTNGESLDCVGASDKPYEIDTHFLQYGRVTEKGQSYTKQITISNNSEGSLVVDATIEKYADAPEANQAMADWLAFVGGVSHFSVAQGATRTVNVRMLVPEDAVAGSQYAVIKLSGTNGFSEAVVARTDIDGEGLHYDSNVAGAWIDIVHLDGTIAGSATIKNTGSAGFTSKYQIRAKSMFGGDWEVVQEEEGEVIPGREYKFSAAKDFGFGVYNVEQRVTFVNSEGRMVESLLTRTVVNMPWWVLAIAGGVVLFIIILIVIIRRHHKKKKLAKQEKVAQRALDKRREAVEKAEEKSIKEEPEEKPVEEAVEEPAEEVVEPKEKPAKKISVKPADKNPAPKKKAPKRISVK